MSFSGHSRTLADIIQRQGDVLARTEMAKHQALAGGLQGVTGALGDWLRGKQEAKTEDEQRAQMQEALKAFFADPSRETLGPLMALNPQVATAAVRGAQAFQEEEPPEVEMTPEQALRLDPADPRNAELQHLVAEQLTGGRRVDDYGAARGVLEAAVGPGEPPDLRREVVAAPGGGPMAQFFEPKLGLEVPLYERPGAPVDPNIARKRELDVQKAERALAGGEGELSQKQLSNAMRLSGQVRTHRAYTDMVDVSNGLDSVESGLAQRHGFGDVAAINGFQRMVDPGATVRAEDVTLLRDASGLIDKILSDYPIEVLRTGAKLPDAVRERMLKTAKALYKRRRKNYNSSVAEQYRKLAKAAGVPYDLIAASFPERGGGEIPVITTPDGKKWRREGGRMVRVEE